MLLEKLVDTSQTTSRIEIIRDIPLGRGGGKKAFIDFNSYINQADLTNDIRIFDEYFVFPQVK